jgi:hypothetical protein
MLRSTEALLSLTVLPPASWTATTGCVAKATPPVDPEGFVVNPSLLAGPTVIVRLTLTSLVSPPAVAVSVYVPAVVILQPAKVATPATALLGFVVQVRAAPPVGGVIAKVTALVPVVVLPPESWIATRGWVPKAMPPVEPEGSVMKATWVAVPKMGKLVLTALVSPPAVAVSV